MTQFEARILELEIRQRWQYTGAPGDCATGREILQSTPTGYDRQVFTRAEFAIVAKVFGHVRLTRARGRLRYAVAPRPPQTEGLAPKRGPAAAGDLRAPVCGCCYCKAVRAGVLALRRAGDAAPPSQRA